MFSHLKTKGFLQQRFPKRGWIEHLRSEYVRVWIAQNEEEPVYQFGQERREVGIWYFLHRCNPSEMKLPGKRILAIHALFQYSHKAGKIELCALRDDVLTKIKRMKVVQKKDVVILL